MKAKKPAAFLFLLLGGLLPLAAESLVTLELEFFNQFYRGLSGSWYYLPSGKSDLRIASTGNRKVRAELSLKYQSVDYSGLGTATPGMSTPVQLKKAWFKADFPSWRLTLGKTKLAWGNGFAFNSGDILFGSLGPGLDFTGSEVRDDTAWLAAFNIPTGPFSFLEGVLLPPGLKAGTPVEFLPIDYSSGGLRFFGRLKGWKLEFGLLYKGDKKVAVDLLGYRPYFSFHGHAGVDVYGAVSLAAGWDASAGVERENWKDIQKTVNISLGMFHQLQAGYDGVLTLRLESLIMPWQNWSERRYEELLTQKAGYYGIMLYPEVVWTPRTGTSLSFRSLISPVDASARITLGGSWTVFQGFTLLGYITMDAGASTDLFAWDRRNSWPTKNDTNYYKAESPNGPSFSLGARYIY